MSAFYEEMAQVAQDLLVEFGRDLTITRESGEVRDPINGRVTPGGVSTQTLKAATLPVNESTSAFDMTFFEGIGAGAMVRYALISVVGHTFVPTVGDKTSFDGSSWRFLGCTPLNVDGTPVVFMAGLQEV